LLRVEHIPPKATETGKCNIAMAEGICYVTSEVFLEFLEHYITSVINKVFCSILSEESLTKISQDVSLSGTIELYAFSLPKKNRKKRRKENGENEQ
jgi:hypothetical protein